MGYVEVGCLMVYQRYVQYTSKWTNVILDPAWREPITGQQVAWLKAHPGGAYHIHRSGTAVRFERQQDAHWFIMRWL
jgi:hypothetical protein